MTTEIQQYKNCTILKNKNDYQILGNPTRALQFDGVALSILKSDVGVATLGEHRIDVPVEGDVAVQRDL